MAIGKAAKWISFATPQQAPPSSSVPHDTVHSPASIADEKQFGLENFGNTCYANSVLQALYFCSPFRDLVIQSTDISAPPVPPAISRQTHPPLLTAVVPRRKSERGKPAHDVPSAPPTPSLVIPSAPPTLFSALRSLYVYISKNPADKGAVAPRAFIDKLRDGNEHFRGIMHQDAHEFLNYLLNKIVEEIQYDKHHKNNDKDSSNAPGEDLSSSVATLVSNNAPIHTAHSEFSPQDGTLVHRLFEGTLTSETRCLTCETVSSRDESFLDLSIDIEQNSSVTACLRQFSASEMLCQRNKFFCDSCCGLQEAEKRMKIKKLPNILALHLKRFKYQEDLKKYIKLTYRVVFPFELRLFNTVDDVEDPDRLYELFGIVVHIGSGPHHGHYVAIVKGPHSWLVFDDDKIEPIKENEIPRYFGDAASGSAYVLYYQAVDLDLASLGMKVHTDPTIPDITVGDLPANTTNASTTNDAPSLETSDPALPPGLGGSSPATAHPLHPHIPTAPSSPSLVTEPLVGSGTLRSRKKSLPSIRIPGTSESSTTSPTTPNRAHGGLFHTLRSSPSGTKIRSDALASSKSATEGVPPVPPVPLRYTNGKEAKEKDKERDKGGEKEREEERSSKEFDRRPSLWFKRRGVKQAKDDREREKEKEGKGKEKEKDAGAPSHATMSATALSAMPSQSDGTSSVSGGSSLWRRSSARVGHHVKRLSATHSSATLGEADTATAAVGSLASGSTPSSHHHHHHHHHHHQGPPGQLPAVPATPQTGHLDQESSTPSSTSSSPILQPVHHHPPPLATGGVDGLLPPLSLGTEALAGTSGSSSPSSLPALYLSPASPPAPPSRNTTTTTNTTTTMTTTTAAVTRHTREPMMVDDNDNDAGEDSDDHDHEHLRARPTMLLAGRRLRGRRPHSVHGSANGTPRDQSTSPPPPHDHEAPSPQFTTAANGAPTPTPTPLSSFSLSFSSSSSSATAKGKDKDKDKDKDKEREKEKEKEKEPVGLRRAARKLSLNAHLFGMGLGLGLGGGRERDRDRDHHHQHHLHHQHQPQQQEQQQRQRHHPSHDDDHHHHRHLGKEDGMHPPSSLFGSGDPSSAALASAVP